jgi:lipopolysaccharide export system protein LptA
MKPAISVPVVSYLALLATAVLWAPPAAAEKADRSKPMIVDADKPGTLDLNRQVVVFSGNVAVVQGTLSLRAERIEVRESKDRQRTATAIGSADKPAAYRQKRDLGNEWIEGSAERIEYDTRSDTLKFSGNASVRRLRGTEVADEITGNHIVWDNNSDVFSVSGGVATPANPAGRIRAVLAPRSEAAASAPAPAVASPEAAPLKSTRSLGEKK